jgi:hypothetical protein
MAIVLKYGDGNAPDYPFLDTWKETASRSLLDKAAAAVENGNQNYWGQEKVEIGENKNTKLAKEEAGFSGAENSIQR